MKFVLPCFVSFFLTCSACWADEALDPVLWKKAMKIHRKAFVADTHMDTPSVSLASGLDLGKRQTESEVDFIRMKEGGLDAAVFAAYVSNDDRGGRPARRTLELIDEIHRQIERNKNTTGLALAAADLRRLNKEGRCAILIGIENGAALEGSPALLRTYHRMGVRVITLVHSKHNDIADSSWGGEPKWNGLSPFGREVVAEMNRLGMMVDVSHASDKAVRDVLEVSGAPVIASHSCARALCDTPRNLSDELLKAIAAKGGLVDVNFYAGFLDPAFKKASDAVEEELKPQFDRLKEKYGDDRNGYWAEASKLWKAHMPGAPGLDVLVDHIDHIVKTAGPDAAGLGSDYDGAGAYPKGLEDASGYPRITYELLKRGYAESDIRKILGGNFLRAFEQMEKAAAGPK